MTTSTIFDANCVLIRAFDSWDGIHETEETRARMIVSVADELEITAEALDATDDPPTDVAVRVIKRAVDRLRLCLEVEAEQVREPVKGPMVTASGNVIPRESILFRVPVDDNGEADLDEAIEATPDDMKRLGWIWHRSVGDAIAILTGPGAASLIPAPDKPADTIADNEPPRPHVSAKTLGELLAERELESGTIRVAAAEVAL